MPPTAPDLFPARVPRYFVDDAVRIAKTLLAAIGGDETAAKQKRLELGRLLVEVRTHFPASGPRAAGWTEFLRAVGVHERSARRYMKLAGFTDFSDTASEIDGQVGGGAKPSRASIVVPARYLEIFGKPTTPRDKALAAVLALPRDQQRDFALMLPIELKRADAEPVEGYPHFDLDYIAQNTERSLGSHR